MSEEVPEPVVTVNPYVSEDLLQAQQQYNPSTNTQFESLHTIVTKKKKTKKYDNDRNYKHVWSDDSDPSDSDAYTEEDDEDEDNDGEELFEDEALTPNRELRGKFDNTDKLVTKYLRDEKTRLKLYLPECIQILCFNFLFIPTNVIFHSYDPRIEHYVDVSNEGKKVKISSRTIFIFSKDGYSSGHHIWHVKCHRVYNCQALGICERPNHKYRYGDNIFDVALNDQLGDRYIYAGDRGHSWRGSSDLRPYVCSVIDKEEYYSKRLNIHNSCWQQGDIITVDLDLGTGKDNDDRKRTITFLKNGKKLHRPITVEKRCEYFPVFQCYQRAEFEIIDDIKSEAIYSPEVSEDEEDDDDPFSKITKGMERPDLPPLPAIMNRAKSLDSDDDSD